MRLLLCSFYNKKFPNNFCYVHEINFKRELCSRLNSRAYVLVQEFGTFSFKISDLTLFGYHCHSMYLLLCSFYNKNFPNNYCHVHKMNFEKEICSRNSRAHVPVGRILGLNAYLCINALWF